MITPDGLYYEIHPGPAGAPAVVLSAGLGGSGAYWAPQMEALTAAHTVVLYDHRGTNRSVRALTDPHSVDAMADDIVSVMDAAAQPRAHVVGHAAGGLVGLSLALRHPDRVDRLAVVNAWAAPDPHIRRCFDTRLHLLKDSGASAYLHAQPLFLFPAEWISRHSDRLDAEEAHHLATFPGEAIVAARIEAVLAFDIEAHLGEIAAEVLVSASGDDMLIPVSCSRKLAQGLPKARLDIAPWGGHGFTVTAPEAFNALLLAFLA
ncbi:MAG: pyrimidine utilization protein [Schumannella sp.]|nr:pyrimidine utilization protein [Schumannella sp.]